jgi:flagellar biosynthesis protein FlhF
MSNNNPAATINKNILEATHEKRGSSIFVPQSRIFEQHIEATNLLLDCPFLPWNSSPIKLTTAANKFADAIPSPSITTHTNHKDTVENLRNEIHSLRRLMETQPNVPTTTKKPKTLPTHADTVKQLAKLGIQPHLILDLIKSIPNLEKKTAHEVTSNALSTLSTQITADKSNILLTAGIITLIGPKTAGKTTTLVKIAQLHSQKFGMDSTVLVSADIQRKNAYEQLQEFGKNISVPVVKATNPTEISQLLLAMKDKRLILIDSGHLTQQEVQAPSSLVTKQITSKNIRHYLMLPATRKYAVLSHLIKSLADEVESCMITRIDETASLGRALSVIASHKLPVSYWTDGPYPVNSLQKATAQYLITKAVTMIANSPKPVPI